MIPYGYGMHKKQVKPKIDLQSCGGSIRTVARNSWIAEGGGDAVGRQYPVCMRTGKQHCNIDIDSHI